MTWFWNLNGTVPMYGKCMFSPLQPYLLETAWVCQVSCSFLGRVESVENEGWKKEWMNSESFISVDSQLKQLEKRPIITLQVWNPQNTLVKGNSSSNSVEIILAVGYNHFLLYFLYLPNNSGHIYWVAFPIKTQTYFHQTWQFFKIYPKHGPDFSETMPHF